MPKTKRKMKSNDGAILRLIELPAIIGKVVRPQWLPVPASAPGSPPSPRHPVGRAECGVSTDPVLLGTQMRLGGCGADARPPAPRDQGRTARPPPRQGLLKKQDVPFTDILLGSPSQA